MDFSRRLGILAMVLALIGNPWLLGAVLAPDGLIETPATLLGILLAEILLVILGVLLINQRFRISVGELLLVAGSALVTAAMVVLLLQIFYKPPTIRVGWRSDVKNLEKNAMGFRGHPISYGPDDFVIVLLGDSYVQANACAYDWMPERRLEEHLRHSGKAVKVFTLGANGYGQDQQLLALEEYLQRYRADLVLLWFYPRNDIWNNVFPTIQGERPKPTFWLEGDTLLGPSERWEEPIWSSGINALAVCQRFLLPSRRDASWERRLPPAYIPLDGYNGSVNRWMMDKFEQGLLIFENLATEKSHFSLELVPRSPRTEYGIKLTRLLLSRIEAMVKGHRAGFAIFTEREDGHDQWPSDEGVYVFRGHHYRLSPEQFSSSVLDLMEGFEFINLPTPIEHAYVGPADPHLNEHAVDAFMESLAKEIMPHLRQPGMRPDSLGEGLQAHSRRTR
jgi:hypothetical protein